MNEKTEIFLQNKNTRKSLKQAIKKSLFSKNRQNQIIPLMIWDSETWHYIAGKCLSRLTTSNGNHYCIIPLISLYSFKTENKLKSHKNVSKNHNYHKVKISEARNEILNFNQEQKYMKILFVIYANTEPLLEKSLHKKEVFQ